MIHVPARPADRADGGRLPLPPDVGEALASCLRDVRPAAAQGREAFAGVRAPHRPLTREAVTQIAPRASRRSGLGTGFAHRLRHTAARAHSAGAPRWKRSARSSAISARSRLPSTPGVDYDGLSGLARPWPGDAA